MWTQRKHPLKNPQVSLGDKSREKWSRDWAFGLIQTQIPNPIGYHLVSLHNLSEFIPLK